MFEHDNLRDGHCKQLADNLQFCCRLFPSSIASRAHDTTQASEVQAPSLVWRWCRKTPCVAPRKCGCRSCRIVSSTRPAATDAIMRLLLLLGLVSTGGIADGNNAAGGCTGMPAARRSGRHTRQSVRCEDRRKTLNKFQSVSSVSIGNRSINMRWSVLPWDY